jgi:hypothetical protein
MDNNYVETDGKNNVVTVAGPHNTNIFRNRMILNGLKFEMKTGMRLTSKAPKCSTLAKKEWGVKGTGDKLWANVMKYVAANPDQFDYVNIDPPKA